MATGAFLPCLQPTAAIGDRFGTYYVGAHMPSVIDGARRAFGFPMLNRPARIACDFDDTPDGEFVKVCG